MASRDELVSERWRVPAGEVVSLAKRDPASTQGGPSEKKEAKDAIKDLRKELAGLQERLWAEDRRSLLVVLQALDAGGKDGTIKHVFRGVNPQGCKVTSFKQPSEVELEHDFLWRIHQATPATGEIGIFNRSHYEDVLVVRVRNIVPEEVWRPRYQIINEFERGLCQAHTRIVKFYLHISKEEQARRFQRRLDRPDKNWKFNKGDLEDRKLWDAFQAAFEDAITETSTDYAPWYVIPGDNKWFRNWAVLTTLIEVLTDMDPQFPEPEEGLDQVEVV
jgi:PPK2 family polyphosphate:nucleotide phosphotransferase